jgi:hypothetical protein
VSKVVGTLSTVSKVVGTPSTVSKVVGTLLHSALTAAGHPEWHTVHTDYDLYKDEILVRFDRGPAEKRECVDFRIPDHMFDPVDPVDPVEYAQARWPHWFKDKSIPNEEQKT